MSSVLFLVDKTLGKYRVLEHLGHGGMAEVYKAQQVNLDRMVALKVLHPFLAEEEGFVERFQREARIVATLRHSNIVQVFDFDHNEELDVYYMVMEYIDGLTLKDRLKDAPLPPDTAVRIAIGIAEALNYAHLRGMVHRDIKPANIMFIDNDVPVLTDFGIARMLSLKGLTASGAMVGTPAYMAPEVGLGQPGEGPSDIYSLGVVLYQLLTAQLPFDSEVPMGLVMKHINDPVPSPLKIIPTLPPALEPILMKMLAKRPEQRYKSGAELANALRTVIGISSPAAPDTPPPTTRTRSGGVIEEEEPLLRTWPALRMQPQSLLEPPPPVAPKTPVQPTPKPALLPRVLKLLGVTLLAILAGTLGWAALNDRLPIALLASPVPPPTAAIIATATATPLPPTPTATMTATAAVETVVPITPTMIASVCTIRADVGRLYRLPSNEVVPPATPLLLYIPLRNRASCDWPEGMTLRLISGDALGAPNSLHIAPVPAGGEAQIVLPLQSPQEAGQYTSVWEIHTPTGQRVSNPIRVTVEVADLPALTPTPALLAVATPTATIPLTLEPPILLTWEDDPAQGLWHGQVQFQASGGSGTYRYYREYVTAATELPHGILEFSWRACEDAPLKLWVLSGAEALPWEEDIPYPAPERCTP